MAILHNIVERVSAGEVLSKAEALALAEHPADLFDTAEAVTKRCASKYFNLCGIVNAKSGACTEDCRWCAQSKHWPVKGTPIFPVAGSDKIEEGAKRAEACGVVRYSLVASGRKPSAREVRLLCERISELSRNHPDLEICVSLGLLSRKDLEMLKAAGVVRIHCNLETSESYFPKVCASHSFADKVKTLETAKALGLSVCSGCLLGIGETLSDRIDLALALRALEVPSIPMNLLHPIAGTPLENEPPLPEEDFLAATALFRLINPTAELRFAGGRLQLSDFAVKEAMRIGMNASISGDFLTTCGVGPIEDARAFVEAGYLPDESAERALRTAQERAA